MASDPWASFTPSWETQPTKDFYGNTVGERTGGAYGLVDPQTANFLAQQLGGTAMYVPSPGGLNNEKEVMIKMPNGTIIGASTLADEWQRNAIQGGHPEIALNNLRKLVGVAEATQQYGYAPGLTSNSYLDDPLMKAALANSPFGPKTVEEVRAQPQTPVSSVFPAASMTPVPATPAPAPAATPAPTTTTTTPSTPAAPATAAETPASTPALPNLSFGSSAPAAASPVQPVQGQAKPMTSVFQAGQFKPFTPQSLISFLQQQGARRGGF